MNLQHLCSAPHVEVYFDKSNNWLFLDWQGDLTLPIMRHALLEIARSYLDNAYPRLLNSNAHVTSIASDLSAWLNTSLIPILEPAGIRQMAWVISPTLPGAGDILAAYTRQQHSVVTIFYDIEPAVAWLQGTQPERTTGCALLPRPLQQNTPFREVVEDLAQKLHAATRTEAT